MSAATVDGILTLLRGHDPLGAARTAGAGDERPIVVRRGPAPAHWLVEDEEERPVADHRAAHLEGRPSEAVVRYGNGVPEEAVARRIAELAALAAETGLLRAVTPVPAEGSTERPGSWGVEDLTVVAACRTALPEAVQVRPSWRHLGAPACQIAVAFGATAWAVPEDDTTDLAHLAEAVGRTITDQEVG